MALSISKVENQLIENIEMDHFGFSTDRIATTGVGPCICFVVILNDGKEVFVEHRSDIFFPAEIELENVALCFQNLAEHVSELLPTSTITTVLILGGNDKRQRFFKLQEKINDLVQQGVKNIDEDVSPYYEQLLNTIKYNDVCFNVEIKSKEYTCQSSVDVVVDRHVNGEERVVLIVQHIKTSGVLDILIGVLAIEIKSNKRSFAIDQSETNNHKDKTPREYQFVNDVAEHFQSHAKILGAIKVEGNLALQLLNYGRCLSAQIDEKFSQNQKKLTDDDQLMCQSLMSSNNNEDDDIDDF